MARWPIAWLAGLVVSGALLADAQTYDWTLAIAVRGGITTSSRIYPNPDASTIDLRTINTPFNSVPSGGVEIRFKPSDENFFLYFSSEYLTKTTSQSQLDGSLAPPQRVPVEDGYRVIPLEFGSQVYVPLGMTRWRLSMGGGVGGYYAERILNEAGVRAAPVGSRMAFGIHVGIRTEYRILSRISAVGSMTFRDPEINVKNKFVESSTTYNNKVLRFPAGEMRSRVNLDGITFSLGIVVEVF